MTADGDQEDPVLSLVKTLFDRMDAWRHLPNYQLERRADLFFALYLLEVLEKMLNCKVGWIIPEFPLHIRTLYPGTKINKSFKADYLAIPSDGSDPILVELKTEILSKRGRQDDYLAEAAKKGLRELLFGLVEIFRATSAKKKYAHLLSLLEEAGQVKLPPGFEEAVYDGPGEMAAGLFSKACVCARDARCRVVYILPKTEPKSTVESASAVEPRCETTVITFADFIESLTSRTDPLSNCFKESLKRWSSVTVRPTTPGHEAPA